MSIDEKYFPVHPITGEINKDIVKLKGDHMKMVFAYGKWGDLRYFDFFPTLHKREYRKVIGMLESEITENHMSLPNDYCEGRWMSKCEHYKIGDSLLCDSCEKKHISICEHCIHHCEVIENNRVLAEKIYIFIGKLHKKQESLP